MTLGNLVAILISIAALYGCYAFVCIKLLHRRPLGPAAKLYK